MTVGLEIIPNPANEKKFRQLGPGAMQTLLATACGGPDMGIVAAIIPRHPNSRLDLEGRQSCTLLITDIAVSGEETVFHTILENRLNENRALCDKGMIQALRVKRAPVTVLLPAVPRDAELTVEQIMQIIEVHHGRNGGCSYLHSTALDGTEIVWPAAGRDIGTVTTSEQMGLIGNDQFFGGQRHLDLRKLAPTTPMHILLEAALRLDRERVIKIYDPDPDCMTNDNRLCFFVYSTRRDAFSTERLKGAMLGPDDMDNDRPADSRRSDNTGGGVEPAKTGKESAAGGFSGGAHSGGMQESEVIPELVSDGEESADHVAPEPKVVKPSADVPDEDNLST
jgi:hypothetical protein